MSLYFIIRVSILLIIESGETQIKESYLKAASCFIFGLEILLLGVFLGRAYALNYEAAPISDEKTGEPNISPTYNLLAYELFELKTSRIHPKTYIEEFQNLDSLEVISDSSVKTYMPISAITDKSSRQWEYLTSLPNVEIIDNRLHLTYGEGYVVTEDEYIGVALGSYFGEIGAKFIFELDTGTFLKLVKVDEKADEHTVFGFYHSQDTSVIEFVVEPNLMKDKIASNGYVYQGNFNNNPEFKGRIVNIWRVI